MAKLCECCGNKNNSFLGDPLYLTNDKILCHKCAQLIKKDVNNLYYAKTNDEYEELKNIIVAKCKECFNDTIMQYIIIILDKIYDRLDFVKKENQVTSSATTVGSTTNTETVSADNESERSFGMFDNIGGKIKAMSQIITWVGIIVSVVFGIVLMSIDEDMIFIGLMAMIFGSLFSWVSSFILYGFGQLVENSDILVKLSKK
ncbi:MAG: hypothetical protein E7408_01485 [Ruminococcaceae bacterium]|nr:hypothetical protein [Oscillospiraceae bacterium]